jgi:hypothetical protein
MVARGRRGWFHPKRALGVHSFPCEVSAAQMRNRAQLAIESNDTSAVAVCWLQARDLADKELKLAKGTAAVSVALPPMALGLLPMAGTIGRHRKTERLCWDFLARHCSTDQLIAVQSMDFKDKDIAGRLRTAFPESVSSSVAHSVVPSQLQETAATQAAAELDRIGSKDLSGPTEMKNLPTQLRDSLIREMAGHFSNLWGNSDPGLSTPKKAIETLKEMAADPTVVFQAQYKPAGQAGVDLHDRRSR